jgi:Ca2+/Na+ antiporter
MAQSKPEGQCLFHTLIAVVNQNKMTKFKKYYLSSFILFGAISIVGISINLNNLDFGLLTIFLCASILFPILIGKYIDYNHNVITPKLRKKYYNKEPFTFLQKIGFKNFNDQYFKGVYKNYQFEIMFEQSDDRYITYFTKYNSIQQQISEYDNLNNIFKSSELSMSLNSYGVLVFKRNFKRLPPFSVLQNDLENISYLLIKNKYEPVIENNTQHQ